jgi:hypothetical protein
MDRTVLMKAIEFEAMAEQHCIRLPDEIPDGIHLRVLLLMDEQAAAARNGDDLKQLLVGVTEGLSAEDLQRTGDFGRGAQEWAI